MLEEFANMLKGKGVKTYQCMLKGDCTEKTLEQAKDQNVDMIVVGSHGKGLAQKLLLGSVSQDIIDQSDVPVMIVPVPVRDDLH